MHTFKGPCLDGCCLNPFIRVGDTDKSVVLYRFASTEIKPLGRGGVVEGGWGMFAHMQCCQEAADQLKKVLHCISRKPLSHREGLLS